MRHLADRLSSPSLFSLADYKCDQCQQVGNVVKRIAPVELPPVLMIPLSRYIYDERGQSKKLRHPIQYPRILEERVLNPEAEQNREYELCAVMIHEGPNTYCGHYYDVIKDPVTNKWFTYNDKVRTSHTRLDSINTL